MSDPPCRLRDAHAQFLPPPYGLVEGVSVSAVLRGLSSMATRQVLADLGASWKQAGGGAVGFESVGGVDAARRVAAGEVFDVVVLASDAIDRLAAAGHVLPGSRVDLLHSGVAVAVPAGQPLPDLSTEDAVRAAVLAAPGIGYSTGPSGTALLALFERWGVMDALRPRLRLAPPGVPVGTLVARGEVALGFQQLSELIHLPGLTLADALPPAIAIDTVFAGAVCTTSRQPEAARDLLAFMASPAADAAKRRQGTTPA